MIRVFLDARGLFALPCLIVLVMTVDGVAQENGNHSFAKTVQPFLAEHCYACHSGDQAEAQFDLKGLGKDFSAEKNSKRWIDVMQALQFGEMPPPQETQPAAIEKADVVGWIFQKMAETDQLQSYQKKKK